MIVLPRIRHQESWDSGRHRAENSEFQALYVDVSIG
jgi:hypothetical protein